MADKDAPRSIRFPQSLWARIDADAKRSKRSANKQMEAVLAVYYGLENTEINFEKLKEAQNIQDRQSNIYLINSIADLLEVVNNRPKDEKELIHKATDPKREAS